MITEKMQQFIDTIELNKEYPWFNEESDMKCNPPQLPDISNIICISKVGTEEQYFLSDGTTCTKEEYENSPNYDSEYTEDNNHSNIYKYEDDDDEDEDYFTEEYYEYEDNNNPYVEGQILQPGYIDSGDLIQSASPGNLKFVLREFKISDMIDITKPIIKFSNNGGDYGIPEIDHIIVDTNCRVKKRGSLDFDLLVYLNEFPSDGIINILVQMSTCLDN